MSAPLAAAGVAEPQRSWSDLLSALLQCQDLTAAETSWAMDKVMSGQATDAQIAGFMIALRAKGETAEELGGLVDALYAHAVPLHISGPAVDIVGTGGDRAHTVNISTMAAIVAAAAGAKVVKHGNRSVSSLSGSSDVLEKLGINLDLPVRRVAEVADETGITFCHAAKFHPAMRHAAPARRQLGVPTAFNFLGPLINPARVTASAIGCFDARMAELMACVLARRGSKGLVFRGDDGLDELTVTGTSHIWVVHQGSVTQARFNPQDLDIPLANAQALHGADPAHNAKVAGHVLAGQRGPVRDAVLLNAAAGLTALRLTDAPLTEQLAVGMARAAEAVDSGAAERLLQRWAAATMEHPTADKESPA
ncbi:anthranilate phosphoribosyltransferase [Streptomyces sp. NPDC051909]|uniref:anthranilate phosphoribosyltransferase n=1 Tax=Streptomyces sp. NPDC051909 TaxID=3154944 RepID=UPI00343F3E57